MVPSGKAIYARRPDWYPRGNPALYAKQLGCKFIALHHFASGDEHLSQAHDLGLDVFLWSHPDSWSPDRWPATLESMAERVYARGLRGFIADPEGGWRGADRGPLADRLTTAAASLPSVGITSYPSWYIGDFMQAAAAGAWGSPQLYGIISPGSLSELHRRAERWRRIFANRIVPSLAAWVRTPIGPGYTVQGEQSQPVYPADQQSYLSGFDSERGAILWQTSTSLGPQGQIKPWPGTTGFEILRRWQPAGGLPSALVARFLRKVVRPYPTRLS